MSSSKSFLTLIKPVGWIYLIWQYRLPFLTKAKDISRLAYCVLVKGNRILVVYTKNHPRMNAVAQNPPQGILFVRLTSKFNGKNYFIKFLASKIDIIYEDGPTTFSLTTDQPIVKEYEHHHFDEQRLADKQIKKIFVMSKWAKPNFDDPEHKMEVLYPAPLKGISARKAKIETTHLTILFVGAAATRKGADILFTAFEQVENIFDQYQLSLVMASNYKNDSRWYPMNQESLDRTRRIYERCQHKKNVYFDRIYPPQIVDHLYENADIYVLPARSDTCPFSILEAMSNGIPIIATNVQAIPEMVKHGKNGFLLEVKDFDVQSQEYFEYAVKEVEKYLSILIEDASLRLEMGNESLRRIKRKFNLDYKKERLKKLFEEIVPRK